MVNLGYKMANVALEIKIGQIVMESYILEGNGPNC